MTESDEVLLDAVRAGDDATLSTLLARHAPTVMRFAMKMCRDPSDAEDVLQETLLTAARGLRELRGGAAISTWLYTVARSHCIKRRRRSKYAPDAIVPLDDSELMAPDAAEPDEAASRNEIVLALERAIGELGDASREVIVLRDVEGLSAPEVAEVLGIGVEAVKSRLHRARAELRARLSAHSPHGEPTTPSDPACPDIVDVLSKHLEGDIGREACAAMEAHVASCASCSDACTSLRRAVSLCGASGSRELSPAAAERVRRAVEKAVRASAAHE